jgi:hypothetical protein
MARYNLPQYQSVYRDPGSIQVNTMLRDRFANALVADDALTASVDGMQSADYDGDNQLKNELAEEYNAKLEERARRGDYETAGMSITKDSRGFIQGYTPIKKNFDRVQAYQAEQKKKLEDGIIDEQTYAATMGISNKDYTGLQKNDDGTINDDSYFSGYRTVKNVDIATEVDEAMEGYKAREGGSEIQLVGQGAGQQYMIKKGSEWSIVPPEDVDAIFNNILSRPDVQASLRQKGDVGTYQLTDEQISTSIGNSLYGDPENEDSQGLIAKYDELVASGKTDKETVAMMDQLEDLIEEQEGLLGDAGVESSEELINKRRNYMKNEVIGREIGRERGAAYAKYVRNDVTTTYIEDYDERYLKDYQKMIDNYVATVSIDTPVTQLNAPSGTDYKSVTTYIAGHDGMIQTVVDEATEKAIRDGYLQKGDKLTAADIRSGNVPEGMVGVLDNYRNKLYALETQKLIAQKRLDNAYKDAGYSTDMDADAEKAFLGTTFKGTFGIGKQSITGQQMVDSINKLYGEDMNYIEALGKFNQLQKIANNYDNPKSKEAQDAISRLNSQMKTDYNIRAGNNRKELVIDDMLQFTNKYTIERNEKTSEYLEKNSKIDVGGMSTNTIPGLDNAQVIKNTKAIKTTFEKQPLDANFEIFYDGLKQDGTGNLASLIDDLGWDEDGGVTVDKVTFDTTPYMGEPTLQFRVKGKEGDEVVYKNIKVPYSNMKMAGMDQYFNSPGYRMALEVNLARHSNLNDTKIGFFDQNGILTSSIKWEFAEGKSSGDMISILDKNGNPIQTITAIEASRMINDASDTRTFRTIK